MPARSDSSIRGSFPNSQTGVAFVADHFTIGGINRQAMNEHDPFIVFFAVVGPGCWAAKAPSRFAVTRLEAIRLPWPGLWAVFPRSPCLVPFGLSAAQSCPGAALVLCARAGIGLSFWPSWHS